MNVNLLPLPLGYLWSGVQLELDKIYLKTDFDP